MIKRDSKLNAYKNKSLRLIEGFASSKIENIFENLEVQALRKRSSFIHLRRRHSNSEGRDDTIRKTWKATSFKIRSPFGCLWNCIPRNSIFETVRHTTRPSICYRTGITDYFDGNGSGTWLTVVPQNYSQHQHWFRSTMKNKKELDV